MENFCILFVPEADVLKVHQGFHLLSSIRNGFELSSRCEDDFRRGRVVCGPFDYDLGGHFDLAVIHYFP